MTLYEKYRPKTWDQVIGQDKAVCSCAGMIQRGLGGQSIWIAGQSGTGKTTIAKLLASEIADPFFVNELDASELTPAALREIEISMRMYGMGAKSGRAYIINEAHGLRRDTVRQLLVLLERLPNHVLIIFTTTNEGQDLLFESDDARPLLSRCIRINLARRDLAKPFAENCKTIAVAEGLDGQPLEKYINLAKDQQNNMRAMLQAVEAGAMIGQ